MAVIYGTSGDDHYLIGTPEADTILAGEGNDTVHGNGGDDLLYGEGGDDILGGGEGKNLIYGGEGSDQVGAGDGNDEVYGEGGNDNINGYLGDDLLDGGAGDDEISGTIGNDVISGGAGADRLIGGYDQDHVDGGDGNDWITGGTWFDHWEPVINADVLLGGAGDDRIWAGYGDTVDGGAGIDILYWGFNLNSPGGPAGVTVDLRQLADNGTVTVAGASITGIEYVLGPISLTDFDDQVIAGPVPAGPNGIRMDGWGGNDQLTGTTAVDALYGGQGDDVLRSGGGYSESMTTLGYPVAGGGYGDVLNGEGGNDTLYAGADGARLNGGTGNDRIYGGAGGDIAYGGGGDDVITGGAGRDFLYGGEEYWQENDISDTLDYSKEDGGGDAYVNLNTYYSGMPGPGPDGYIPIRRALDTYGNLDLIDGFENVITGAGNDSVYGNFFANRIETGAGNDVIDGGGGNDVMIGGAGDDTYWFHSHFYDGSPTGTILELAGGGIDEVATTFASFSIAGIAEVENLTGYSASGGSLTGNGLDNVITGAGGADSIDGAGGNDTLDGGGGDDMMTGGSGNDIYVVGSAGDIATEAFGEGTDEVRTALAVYTLVANVENLTATSDVAHDFRGNGSNNVVTGGAGNDIIRLQDGGDDTAIGGGGNDGILFGAALSAGDVVDGGEGSRDQLGLQGNYGTFGAGATPFTLGASHLVNIEMLVLLSGSDARFGDTAGNAYSYNLATLDANVAAGQQLVVNFNTLGVGENVTFNGSAETDGSFMTYGGLGIDILTGGQQSDAFYFGADGRFGSGDRVDGQGGSFDQLGLQGDYSGARAVSFAANSLAGIEMLVLLSAGDNRFGGGSGDGFSYDIVMNDANVADGARMFISANTLRSDGTLTETLDFDGSAEKDGFFTVYAGSGADTIVGGERADELWGRGGADTIRGGLGADILRGGEGGDVFDYDDVAESGPGARDSILDFASGSDRIDLSGIDANSLADGDQAFTWIGTNGFGGSGAASAGQLRVYEAGASWIVEGDTDGDGIADLVIQIPLGALAQSDFVL